MRKQWGKNSRGAVASVLLFSWVVLLLLAYGAHYRTSGFFIDYFREFLPPLAIICAAWLRHSVQAFENQRTIATFVFWALCLGAVWFAVQSRFPIVGIGYLSSLAIAGRPLLILGVLLMVLGVQLFSIGLLGEIIIFTHARELKDYQVEEILE
jgi:hypothetical protein